jgi:hypothetical protein
VVIQTRNHSQVATIQNWAEWWTYAGGEWRYRHSCLASSFVVDVADVPAFYRRIVKRGKRYAHYIYSRV